MGFGACMVLHVMDNANNVSHTFERVTDIVWQVTGNAGEVFTVNC